MAIARLSLLLVTAIGQLYTVTPPNVRPPSGHLRELRGAEHSIPLIVIFMRICVWLWALPEGLVLFALSGYCPPTIANPLLHFLLPIPLTSDPTILTTLTPTFLAGVFFSLTGSLLRGHCYRALGKHFTFELSIRPSHKLVTDGMYGIVRHPSYTGIVVVGVGWLLCVSDRQGSMVAICVGWAQAFSGNGGQSGNGNATLTGVLAGLWVTVFFLLYQLVSNRIDKEDLMLKKTFGKEWEAWATRVPYCLVPGVY